MCHRLRRLYTATALPVLVAFHGNTNNAKSEDFVLSSEKQDSNYNCISAIFISCLFNCPSRPPWTITTALMICHRFFQTHSLDENDRFIIGVASLYLAGKIQNTVKSPLEVISNGWEVNSRGNPAESVKLSHNVFNDM